MSAHDVQTKILEPMQRLYLPPRNMDEGSQTAALRDYVESLEEFEGSDLSEAWRKVRDTHVTRGWPLPAAFKKAASEARRDRNEVLGVKAKRSDDSKQKWEEWKKVSKTPMAREAVKRGVSCALKCAVLYDGKKADQIDLRQLVSGKERAARQHARIMAYEPLMNEETGEIIKPLNTSDRETALNMYAHIRADETRTAQEINYGVSDLEAAQ